MPRHPKPDPGSWTAHFGLDTGPISYEDSISDDYYRLEREAVFKQSWLNVGRVELLSRPGSLDKELYGLVSMHCEVWEGFIFVNLSEMAPDQRGSDEAAGRPVPSRSSVLASW